MALDGVSLTVNDCGPDFLEINVIPETWRVTTVAAWKPGAAVNMETDVIGKYVRRMIAPHLGAQAPQSGGGEAESRVTLDFLRENGFF